MCQCAAFNQLNLGKKIRGYGDPGHGPGGLCAWVVQSAHPKRAVWHGDFGELSGDIQKGLQGVDIARPDPQFEIGICNEAVQRDAQKFALNMILIAGV